MSQIARQLIEEEEGRVPHVYRDHLGYWTIGIGHLVDQRKGGRLPDPIIDALFDYDYAEKRAQAERIPGFSRLNEVQQAAIVSMVFQMGFEPFDGDGFRDFRNMLAALARGDVKEAARHGRDSKWWREDTPRRAERQMRMLESGLWVPRDWK